MVDFEKAATKAAPAVVHIKTLIKGRMVTEDMPENPFEQFFGDGFGQSRPQAIPHREPQAPVFPSVPMDISSQITTLLTRPASLS